MATNKIYDRGAVMPWTNGTGSDVASGDPVEVNDLVGVALGDIADGESGNLDLEGVWELPKEAGLAVNQGDQLYFDAAAGEFDKTNTNTPAGKAFADAANAATVVWVKLNG